MAFITHCLKNVLHRLERLSSLASWPAAIAMALCVMTAGAHAGSTMELQSLRVQRGEEQWQVSGKWRYELSVAMQDALIKGVALHFVTEADITRERWYFYDKRIAHAERHHRLSYLPLTQRWRLNSANQPMSQGGLGVSLGQTFDTLEEATAAMQRVSQWRVASASEIEGDMGFTLEMKFRLDLNQLPRPLQIGALGQQEWTLAYSKRMPLVLESGR